MPISIVFVSIRWNHFLHCARHTLSNSFYIGQQQVCTFSFSFNLITLFETKQFLCCCFFFLVITRLSFALNGQNVSRCIQTEIKYRSENSFHNKIALANWRIFRIFGAIHSIKTFAFRSKWKSILFQQKQSSSHWLLQLN